MSQSTAWRGHSKSLSEKLSASFWREIIWKWGEGHLWNEVRLHLKEKKKKRGITRSVCDLSKARRSPRPQWWGRGDPKIDSTSVAGFPTVIPSIWSFISMLCWAHPTLLCMQWRFRTRPQISCAASPPGSRERRIHLQENIIICDLAWDHLSPIVCTQSQGNFFSPTCMQLIQGGKREYDLDPADATGSFISRTPCRLWGFGVNISRLFHSEVLASWFWKLGPKVSRACLFFINMARGHMQYSPTFSFRPVNSVHSAHAHFFFITHLLPAGTWAPNGWIPNFSWVENGWWSFARTSTRFMLQ